MTGQEKAKQSKRTQDKTKQDKTIQDLTSLEIFWRGLRAFLFNGGGEGVKEKG